MDLGDMKSKNYTTTLTMETIVSFKNPVEIYAREILKMIWVPID